MQKILYIYTGNNEEIIMVSEIQPSQVKFLSETQLAELAKKYSIDPNAQPKSELSEKIINSIMSSVNDAKQVASNKEAAYKTSLAQYNVFSAGKSRAQAKLTAAQLKSQTGYNTGLSEAESEYSSASKNATNWRIDSEVALGSWQSANSYAGKLGNCAGAASIFGI